MAINKIKGNEENSSGLCTFTLIIIMTNPVMMLNVNKISSAVDGRGMTSIAIMASNTSGIASTFKVDRFENCLKFDTKSSVIKF